MKLIRFTLMDGRSAYINEDAIESILPAPGDMTAKIFMRGTADGECYQVKFSHETEFAQLLLKH